MTPRQLPSTKDLAMDAVLMREGGLFFHDLEVTNLVALFRCSEGKNHEYSASLGDFLDNQLCWVCHPDAASDLSAQEELVVQEIHVHDDGVVVWQGVDVTDAVFKVRLFDGTTAMRAISELVASQEFQAHAHHGHNHVS